MENSFIEKVSDILAKLPMFSESQQVMMRELGKFYGDWKTIAGDRYYTHAKPVDIKNGILIIEVEHSGWISLIQFKAESIVKRMESKYPELKVKGVAFRLSNQVVPEKKPVQERKAAEKPQDTKCPDIQEVINRIEDPDFRKLMERVSVSLLDSCSDT